MILLVASNNELSQLKGTLPTYYHCQDKAKWHAATVLFLCLLCCTLPKVIKPLADYDNFIIVTLVIFILTRIIYSH